MDSFLFMFSFTYFSRFFLSFLFIYMFIYTFGHLQSLPLENGECERDEQKTTADGSVSGSQAHFLSSETQQLVSSVLLYLLTLSS